MKQAKSDPGVINEATINTAVCGVQNKLAALGDGQGHHLVTLVTQVQTHSMLDNILIIKFVVINTV